MRSPNVLFLLIDCLRADACHGEVRHARTPTLDALCSQGTAFTQAISVAGNTPVCFASLFTGVYPFAHGIRPLSLNRFYLSTAKLNPNCRTLAETLRDSGYATYATVTGPILHVTDLDRGFERYDYRQGEEVYLHDRFGTTLKQLLADLTQGARPWFLFVHLWELHAPRQVAPEFNARRYGRDRYWRAVSSLDRQLGRILDEIDLGTTLVIVHGDHGEGTESPFEFLLHPSLHDRIGIRMMRLLYTLFFKWIHQYRFLQSAHGLNLYEYMVRVPLIVAGPEIPRGHVVPHQVSQVDIMPTLLEMLRVPRDAGTVMHGRSLCPLIAGETWEERPVYMETYSGKSVAPRYAPMVRAKAGRFAVPPALVAMRTSQWKCIWVPDDPMVRTELYHLQADPSERRNLIGERPDVALDLQSYLSLLLTDGRPSGSDADMSSEEQAMLEKRLRELGYI
jgi:arylsulfatase A-like enzyme